jgi:predicted Zn-dependent protease
LRAQAAKGQVILVLAGEGKPGDLPASGTNGIVVVDLKALKLADMTTPVAQETYARRVEKLAVAGVALQLGMLPCPFPRCALYQHETVQELDEKARGLCPPCMGKLPEVIERYRNR